MGTVIADGGCCKPRRRCRDRRPGCCKAGAVVLRPAAVVLLTGVDTSPANSPGFFLPVFGTVVRLGAAVAVGVVGICLLFLCGIEDAHRGSQRDTCRARSRRLGTN